jgi:hypothetical protein
MMTVPGFSDFFELERVRVSEAPTEIGLHDLPVKYDY